MMWVEIWKLLSIKSFSLHIAPFRLLSSFLFSKCALASSEISPRWTDTSLVRSTSQNCPQVCRLHCGDAACWDGQCSCFVEGCRTTGHKHWPFSTNRRLLACILSMSSANHHLWHLRRSPHGPRLIGSRCLFLYAWCWMCVCVCL